MAEGSQQEENRTEPASPFKLREARKKGQVAKSLEINSLILLGVALMVSYFLAERFIQQELVLSQNLFVLAGQLTLDPETLMALFEKSLLALFDIFWPVVLAFTLAGVVANMLQTGPIFSFFPVKPDLKRLNPITGFKRLFSKKLLFESFKSIVKIAIFGAVIYFAVVSFLPTLMGLIDTDPQVYPKLLIDEGRELAYKLILALLIIALLDLVYTRWDYAQQMRMSHRDVKEEVKRREGDPQIRSKRRQLQKEAVERAGSIRKVPDADVLITNPTHLAIAIKYQRHTMIAPEVIAKGAGELAAAMKKVAKRHNVVTVENKKLARALFKKSDVDGLVPEALYPETAKILAWVFMQQQMMSANTNKRNFD